MSSSIFCSLLSGLWEAYCSEGNGALIFWDCVSLTGVTQEGCQASAAVSSVSPRSENSAGFEGFSTAEKTFPTRMPCFLQCRVCHQGCHGPVVSEVLYTAGVVCRCNQHRVLTGHIKLRSDCPQALKRLHMICQSSATIALYLSAQKQHSGPSGAYTADNACESFSLTHMPVLWVTSCNVAWVRQIKHAGLSDLPERAFG